MPLDFAVVLFEGFETLDVFGPVEVMGMLPEKYRLEFYSAGGGIVRSSQKVRTDTLRLSLLQAAERREPYVLFLPGGMGTRTLVHDAAFVRAITALGFVSDTEGRGAALEIARRIEYVWNENSEDDPFATS